MKDDYRDLMLEAAAETERLMMEFEKMLAMPAMRGQMAQVWMTLPEEAKEKFKREQPEAYHTLMEGLKSS